MKKIILLLSAFAILLFSNIDLKNKSFNSAGNIFVGATNKVQNRSNKHINPSNNFWTSGRFNF